MHSFTNSIPILLLLAVSATSLPVNDVCFIEGFQIAEPCSKLAQLRNGDVVCPKSILGEVEKSLESCCNKEREGMGRPISTPSIDSGSILEQLIEKLTADRKETGPTVPLSSTKGNGGLLKLTANVGFSGGPESTNPDLSVPLKKIDGPEGNNIDVGLGSTEKLSNSVSNQSNHLDSGANISIAEQGNGQVGGNSGKGPGGVVKDQCNILVNGNTGK